MGRGKRQLGMVAPLQQILSIAVIFEFTILARAC
jgi:hypothetical protein